MNHNQQCFVQPCLFGTEHEYSSISPGSLGWSRTNPLSCLPHHCVTVNTYILREEYDRGLSTFFWWALSRNWMVLETIKETIKKISQWKAKTKKAVCGQIGSHAEGSKEPSLPIHKDENISPRDYENGCATAGSSKRGMRLGGVEDASSCFPNTLLVTHIHPEGSLLMSSKSSHSCFNITGLQPTVFY